ncbi:BlaI/MecI/CopY family transcriptional regulator [Xiashengella succiniciproducens]|uniref:BlaI/MecI/CopY family transcriptional regulator n=1 Tax=Xiashengella succiniciproducens TaxID=2949635 RepID=A0A9J6ZM72_9BACT|nr:BlaI/MecI/CopY family transcriptional regulator [Alkaliflexus sp. Ai-910]URW78763.1 BlaI/MecI/CopY family transcriptional regulator [Alkaliflexus sp. Ai-910]
MRTNYPEPTESEVEILQILWQKGSATVREVHEVLETKKDVGYTTTLKLMQIMVEKGIVDRDTSKRIHIYKPLIPQSSVENNLINKLRQKIFRGSASRLVIGALSSEPVSEQEIEEIREFLDSYTKDNHSKTSPK